MSIHHHTISPPVLQYFIDCNAGFHRAYAISHPGPFRLPLSPLRASDDAVREWMAAHMVGAIEVAVPEQAVSR